MTATPRLRVCVVSPGLGELYRASGAGAVGGTEVMSDLVARHLARHADVHVVTSDVGERLVAPAGITLHAAAFGRLLRSRPRALAGLRYAAALARTVRAVRPDIVYQHCSGLEAPILARAARRQGWRFVYHWGADSDATGVMAANRPALAALFVRGRRGAALQLCQTEEQLAKLGARERGILFPNPLNDRVIWTRSRGGSVLWVGRLRPLKRPDRFLDVAAALPQHSFELAGSMSGDAHYDGALRARMAALPNVRWHGFASDKLGELYARAQCLLNTSDREGFPNTFLEAAAAGVPIVSLSADPNGMLSKDGAGTCVGGNEAALVPAVERQFDLLQWPARQVAAMAVAQRHDAAFLVAGLAERLHQLAAGGTR